MKVLLSAYACEPNKGSEPEVGWHWAMEIARLGHEVWVLTRANNQPVIETEFLKQPQPANLHFFYYDLPAWARWWKKGGRGVHLYYLLWQWGAYLLVKKRHEEIHFDLVHHITFVSVRQPSFMGNLGIPFIFGPVAGGERAPWRLRIGYGARGFLLDALRDIANLMVKIDPLMRRTFKQAKKIYATSEQTLSLIPEKYQHKAMVQLAIGIEDALCGRDQQQTSSRAGNNEFRILYVGRFVYWKGMHLGLRAFANLVKDGVDARLTLVGQGPDEKRWRRVSEQLGVTTRIDWIPWVTQDELAAIYARHDVFLFPSLHDSGGMVVLEAMAHGLPVVCFGLGGPGQNVDATCGRVVCAMGLGEDEASNLLAKALGEIGNAESCEQLSAGARRRASDFAWSKMVGRLYSPEVLPC